MPHPIFLYDGVCGLCNRFVQFMLQRDPAGVFRFASLQSELATRILAQHSVEAADLDTLYVVVNYGLPEEQILPRSDAVIFILRHLGAAELLSAHPGQKPGTTQGNPTSGEDVLTPGLARWRLAAFLLQLVPRPLRDSGYRIVAHNRYRIFGRYDTCPMPNEDTRSRFLDL